EDEVEDDRLRLIFTCCHPALTAFHIKFPRAMSCPHDSMQFSTSSISYPMKATRRLPEIRSRAARSTPDGELVLLADQDRTLWDRALITEGISLVERAISSRRFGPYTLQAAISAVHAEALAADATDWPQIVGLYDVLARVDPSPIIELNRAAAIAMRDGPEAGLAIVDAILTRGDLDGYHLAHSARADLCRRLGRVDEARKAYQRALELVRQEPERRFLERRLRELPTYPPPLA
ncbi:MAG TPA: DUF6596 domain-containing protein, partial [Vicinamibacterales bacterium]|nr:DUF6596 domain-containing protein [Vicinamibacterales bacterium]